jgi:hypothetical protein
VNHDNGRYNQKRYRIGEFIQWVEATRKGKDFWNPEVVSDWGSLHKERNTAFNQLSNAIPEKVA